MASITPAKCEEMDELSRRQKEEYEMQLFGFHSRIVKHTLIEKIKENLDQKIKEFGLSVVKNCKFEKKELSEFQKNLEDLRKLYRNNMQIHLKTVENIIDRFINVPDYVLLEEDKCQETQYSDEEFMSLQKENEELQKEAKRVTIYNVALQTEIETLDKLKDSEEMAKMLCGVIREGLATQKLDNKITKSVEMCRNLEKKLNEIKPKTKKEIYNPKINENDLQEIYYD